ncbi:MAG: DNA recombination protein RmuC [Proteobacteria bacterium]|nr:DNA recombination protein RmuC [Pseudomonadota bacterium]MBU1715313.1 DNA recombination protein RmuC [Pseudomonadota bacterium]
MNDTHLHYLISIISGLIASVAIWLYCRTKQKLFLSTLRSENETLKSSFQAHVLDLKTQLLESKERARELGEQATRLHGDKMALQANLENLITKLAEEKERAAAKQTDETKHLINTFKALSNDILKNNNQSFMEIAQTSMEKFHEKSKSDLGQRQLAINELIKPLKESLEKIDNQNRQIEKERVEAYGSLTEQIRTMTETQINLRKETANLVRSLRAPNVRGRWGEIQLRRVVEMAGMIEYCDFIEQESTDSEKGKLRPDMVIKLPGGKNIVVDSKTVLMSYLDAQETANPEEKTAFLKNHARQIRVHLAQLSSKSYWEQFQPSPEFVVLFVPGENFFSAALEQDPELIEFGVSQKVILATPTTLIALLRAVSYGWRQENVAENAKKISDLGKVLYDRLCTMAKHFTEIKKGLDRTVSAYNKTVGSFESRVLISARQLKEHDSLISKKIERLQIIENQPRQLQTDLLEENADDEG